MGRRNDSGISDQKDRLSTEYSTMFQKEIISAVSVSQSALVAPFGACRFHPFLCTLEARPCMPVKSQSNWSS